MTIIARIVFCLLPLIAAFAVTTSAFAQATRPQGFPAKVVRIVVPYSPGGATDLVGRVVAKGLTDAWGQGVIVENRPGADGNIGIEQVAKSAPDGHTLIVVAAQNIAVNPHVHSDLRFDIFKDLAPLSLMAKVSNVLVVNSGTNLGSVRELVDAAKAKPGTLNYASPSFGSQGHVAAEMFKMQLGVDIHHIPYQGYGPAITDVLGGQVTMLFAQVPGVLSLVKAGKLRALGVASESRSPLLPSVPTLREATGARIEAVSWNALFAPSGTPDALLTTIAADIANILRASDLRDQFGQRGVELVGSTPAELASFMRSEYARYGDVVRNAGIRAKK